MSKIHTIIVLTTVVLLGLQLLFERRRYQSRSTRPADIFKALTSIGFVALGFAVSAHTARGGYFLLASLLLALAGDLFLTSNAPRYFRAGLLSFLLAHLGYAAYFASLSPGRTYLLAAAPLLLLTGGAVYKWLHPHLDKPMRIPVAAYVLVISTMVTLSVGVFGAGRSVCFPIAAIIFMASDVGVARDRFVAPGYINRLVSLPMYYAAQLIFAASPLFL